MSTPPRDPRDPPVQNRDAVIAYGTRGDVGPSSPDLPTDEEWERLEAHQGLWNLIEKYGAKRVMTWVRSLAAIHGEEV